MCNSHFPNEFHLFAGFRHCLANNFHLLASGVHCLANNFHRFAEQFHCLANGFHRLAIKFHWWKQAARNKSLFVKEKFLLPDRLLFIHNSQHVYFFGLKGRFLVRQPSFPFLKDVYKE